MKLTQRAWLACLVLGLALAAVLPAWSAETSGPSQAYKGFFVTPRPQGETAVEFHADPRVVGQEIPVSFGAPFPAGFVTDEAQVSLVGPDGQEVPIATKVLARWMAPVPGAGSIRSVLIQCRLRPAGTDPVAYKVKWGAPRQKTLGQGWPSRAGWLTAQEGGYPQGSVMEPAVYATFPPAWLGQCLLKGRILAPEKRQGMEWYDQAMANFFRTVTNDYDYPIKEKYLTKFADHYEPWLFDRATTFFVVYMRLGDVKYLRAAHRAAQYYASKINPEGKFVLLPAKKGPDVKYGYQECLALDYWLFGDEKLGQTVQRVAKLLDAWDPEYSTFKGFWTERHWAFNLLNATGAYEITGDPRYRERAAQTFGYGLEMQQNPAGDISKGKGAMVHYGPQHGKPSLKEWIACPWMSALASDAALRYYLATGDERVPQLLEGLANYIVTAGLYQAQGHVNWKRKYTAPYYLTYLGGRYEPYESISGDIQHALDVAGLLAKGYYFQRQIDPEAAAAMREAAEKLLESTRFIFDRYHNKLGAKHGRPLYRVHPSRQFNWWFRTTADIGFLLRQE